MRNAGFTLIELLIAATIIGALVIFATQSFRNASSEIRMKDMQSRAKMVAMAARRFKIDYPAAVVDTGNALGTVTSANPNSCNHSTITLQNLVNCGYLEYYQYASERRAGNDYKSHFTLTFLNTNPIRVCVVRKAASAGKILDDNSYCTDGESWD